MFLNPLIENTVNRDPIQENISLDYIKTNHSENYITMIKHY